MPQSLATLEAVTKAIYSGKLRKQLNDEVKALKRVKRSGDNIVTEVGGKYVTFPVHTRRNTGIGARNENEPLPRAGKQGAAVARIGLKYQYGALELTGQAIRLADKDYQSFISAVEWETDRIKVDVSLDLNRQVYGDGTGTLAKATAAATVTTIAVNDTNLLDLDMLVDVVNSTNGAIIAAGRTIIGFDEAAKTVTISGAAVAVTLTSVLTRQGNWNREWLGFDAMVGTGVYENIDPSVEPIWKGNIDSNGGTLRSVSEGLLNRMSDTIKKKGGKSTILFTTYEIRRAYANLLQQQRHYVNTNGKFDGGYTSLSYSTPDGEIPFEIDRMAPANRIWFINEDHVTLYQDADWDFMDYGGDKWRLKQAGGEDYDAYVARIFQYSNLGSDRRNTHGVINDVAGA